MSQLRGRQQGKQRSCDGSHLLLSKVSCCSSRHIGPGATQQDGVRSRHKDQSRHHTQQGRQSPDPFPWVGAAAAFPHPSIKVQSVPRGEQNLKETLPLVTPVTLSEA